MKFLLRLLYSVLSDPLITCGILSVVIWLFAVLFSILAAIDLGKPHEITARGEEGVTAICASILFGAFTIASVIDKRR